MSTCSHLLGTWLLLGMLAILPHTIWGQASASISFDGAKAEEAAALSLYAEAENQAAQAQQYCLQLQRYLSDPACSETEAAHSRQLCDDLFEATEALAYWREHFQSLSHLATAQQSQTGLQRRSSYESQMAAQRYDLEGVCLRLNQLILQADQLLQAVE